MLALQMLDPANWEEFKIERKAGETAHWKVHHFQTGENDPERVRHMQQGRDTGVGSFTGLAYRKTHPAFPLTHEQQYELEHFGREPRDWQPMMSDSRAEVLECLVFLDKVAWALNSDVTPRVVIGGLGLGMVAEGAAKMGAQVDVIEFDEEVISLIAPQLDHYDNLRVIHGDVFKHVPDREYDLAWWDIWPHLGADNLPQMRALKRRWRKWVTGGLMDPWQGCWAWEQCLYMHRMQRTDPYEILRDIKRSERLRGTPIGEVLDATPFGVLRLLQYYQERGDTSRLQLVDQLLCDRSDIGRRRLGLLVRTFEREMKAQRRSDESRQQHEAWAARRDDDDLIFIEEEDDDD